jgi:hypothetical protein
LNPTFGAVVVVAVRDVRTSLQRWLNSRVMASDPETTRVPPGEKVTDLTELEQPSSRCSSSPVDTFQIRTVLSSDPETTRAPSREKTTDRTHASELQVDVRRRIPDSNGPVIGS